MLTYISLLMTPNTHVRFLSSVLVLICAFDYVVRGAFESELLTSVLL